LLDPNGLRGYIPPWFSMADYSAREVCLGRPMQQADGGFDGWGIGQGCSTLLTL